MMLSRCSNPGTVSAHFSSGRCPSSHDAAVVLAQTSLSSLQCGGCAEHCTDVPPEPALLPPSAVLEQPSCAAADVGGTPADSAGQRCPPNRHWTSAESSPHHTACSPCVDGQADSADLLEATLGALRGTLVHLDIQVCL